MIDNSNTDTHQLHLEHALVDDELWAMVRVGGLLDVEAGCDKHVWLGQVHACILASIRPFLFLLHLIVVF